MSEHKSGDKKKKKKKENDMVRPQGPRYEG